jgi:hypothetical protein
MNYQSIVEDGNMYISETKKKIDKIAYVRLLFMSLFIFFIYYCFKIGFTVLLTSGSIISLMVFLFFVNMHQKLTAKVEYEEKMRSTCEDEIEAQKGLLSQFDGGIEYLMPSHPFALDLDIFSNKSIFQLLNRTFTQNGKDTLAKQLQNLFYDKDILLERQESIKELNTKVKWRVDFITTGKLLEEDSNKFKQLNSWLNKEIVNKFDNYKILVWLTPIFNISLFLLSIIGITSWLFFAISFILQLSFWGLKRKKIDILYEEVSRQATILERYVGLFKLIEDEHFDSTLLNEHKKLVENCSEKVLQLSKIVKLFEFRFGIGLPFFILLYGDYSCAYRFEYWKKHHAKDLSQAFSIIHELEVLVGIGCFAFANPQYVIPEISDKEILKSSNLGHPLLKNEIRICNNFQFDNQQQIFIVTGANMAGKSTFLRAIGSNWVLAMLGAPVCASKFIFKPLQIFSCMRISDSIDEGESYFHAELARLQMIINLLENGTEIFVILDELLKGTNSKDKLKGSELFLERLLSYSFVHGLIATHDLDLTIMENNFPSKIKNICFEVLIEQDKMIFDYKLKQGVTQNMNAIFLMKQMRII